MGFSDNVLAAIVPPSHDVVSIGDVYSRFFSLQRLTPSMYLRTLINLLIGLAGVLSFVSLLIGGLQWILAGGDKEGTEKARKRILSALIGLAIVFSAYTLIYIIRVLFNVNLIQVELTQIGT